MKLHLIVAAFVALFATSACTTHGGGNAQIGALIGAGLGAYTGQELSDEDWAPVVGAVAGAYAGQRVGQAVDNRQATPPSRERNRCGPGQRTIYVDENGVQVRQRCNGLNVGNRRNGDVYLTGCGNVPVVGRVCPRY